MRRILVFALLALAACGGDGALDPVQTVDGNWSGEDNGINLSLNMVQADTTVGGGALVGSPAVFGFVSATVSGTFKYPTLHITVTPASTFQSFTVDANMSPTEARLDAVVNGAGFNHVTVALLKK
jgi:hypothetical protein